MSALPRPIVAVSTLLVRWPRVEPRILLGRRGPGVKTSAGVWAPPAGHAEGDDPDLATAAERELTEETGLEFGSPPTLILLPKLFVYGGGTKTCIHVVAVSECPRGPAIDFRGLTGYREGFYRNAEIREPDKCVELGWFEPGGLPEPRWESLDYAVAAAREAGLL